MHHCLIHPSRYFEEGASCPECAAPITDGAKRIADLEACIRRILRENDKDGKRAGYDHARECLSANASVTGAKRTVDAVLGKEVTP